MPAALILGCDGTALSASEAAFFRETDPYGFILFRRNVEAPEQVRALVDALRHAVDRDHRTRAQHNALRGPRRHLLPLAPHQPLADQSLADLCRPAHPLPDHHLLDRRPDPPPPPRFLHPPPHP